MSSVHTEKRTLLILLVILSVSEKNVLKHLICVNLLPCLPKYKLFFSAFQVVVVGSM